MSGKTTTLLNEYTAMAGITRTGAKKLWNAMDWQERTTKRKQVKAWVKFVEGYAAMLNISKWDARKECVGMNDSERSAKLPEVKNWLKNARGFASIPDTENDGISIKDHAKTSKALNSSQSSNTRKRRLENKIKRAIIAHEAPGLDIRIRNGHIYSL